MKKYDFEKAQKLINENKEQLVSASLGMHEDWFWTAETIFEDGKYTRPLEGTIGGIDSSSWATPSLMLYFKEGDRKTLACYKGESSESKPSGFSLGVMSSEVQENMPDLEEEGE